MIKSCNGMKFKYAENLILCEEKRNDFSPLLLQQNRYCHYIGAISPVLNREESSKIRVSVLMEGSLDKMAA